MHFKVVPYRVPVSILMACINFRKNLVNAVCQAGIIFRSLPGFFHKLLPLRKQFVLASVCLQ